MLALCSLPGGLTRQGPGKLGRMGGPKGRACTSGGTQVGKRENPSRVDSCPWDLQRCHDWRFHPCSYPFLNTLLLRNSVRFTEEPWR